MGNKVKENHKFRSTNFDIDNIKRLMSKINIGRKDINNTYS